MKKYIYGVIAALVGIVALIFRGKLQKLNQLQAQAEMAKYDQHVQDLKIQYAQHLADADAARKDMRVKQQAYVAAVKKAQGINQ